MVALGAKPENVCVIVNGVDIPADMADVGGTSSLVGVVVANFHAYKGHPDLLHALALLPQELDIRLRFCGSGPERSAMQTLAEDLGLSHRVVFVEPPADIPSELQLAQFAVHPSHSEGLSNAVLEELAAGLPVIACRVGGNPTLIVDGANGLLVPPADCEALAKALAQLASSADLRIKMAANARLTAQRFDWSACVEAHLKVYTTVAAGKTL
jgi:glycosyltransferase involved in cell wall biosynthesis